jgi:hypothetical protein
LQNHLPTNFDFEFGSNGVVQLLAGIKGKYFVFCPLRFQNSFQMQPIQWMRVKMQTYFASIQLCIILNIIEYRIFVDYSRWRGVNVIVDVIVKSVDKNST